MTATLPATPSSDNPFRAMWDLGYHRLVPVIPPGADLFDDSSVAVRLRKGDDSRGKAPGIRRSDGKWQGLHFVAMESQEQDLASWNAMGAAVGVKTGQGLIAIDVDTIDKASARIIYELATQHLGPARVRFGRAPKCLMLYRAPEATPYRKVSFSTEIEDRAAVEMLTEGRQFVAQGVHPKTGKPYTWPHGVPPLASLASVTHEALDAFFAAVAAKLPNAKAHASADDRQAPDQESLQAPSFERLKELLDNTPNTSDFFPDREAYVRMAYAIKGAAPDGYEHSARDLFLDWCAKWTGPNGEVNDLDIALADWDRAKPPYRTGIRFLEKHAVGLFFKEEEPIEPDEVDLMFASDAPAKPKLRIELLTDEQLQTMPDPRWLIGRHIPETGFGILFGDPGTYKSFLALDMGLSIAAGFKDWYGDPIAEDAGAVLYIAGEGAGAFKLRIRAWKKQNWVEDEMMPADRFRVVTASLNFMRHEDIADLLAVVEASGLTRIAMIIVDTVSRAIPGADENKQQDMSIFVKACDTLRDRTGAFILGIHHAAKSGDMRGSSVIPGGGDAIFRVERKKGQNYVRLTCTKQKDAPDQWHDSYRLNLINLGGDVSSLAPVRVEEKEVEEAICTDEIKEQIFAAIMRDARSDNHWSMASQARSSGRKHAVHEIAAGWGVGEDVAEQWLDMWTTGPEPELRTVMVDSKSKRKGLVVVDTPIMDGVFG